VYLVFVMVGVVLLALGVWEVAVPPQFPFPDSSLGMKTLTQNAQTVLIPIGAAVLIFSLTILFLLELGSKGRNGVKR